MKPIQFALLHALGALPLLAASAASAQIAPDRPPEHPGGGTRATRLSARVEVEGGVATTSLSHVLHNDGHLPAEAIWILPLPPGAVADGLRLTANGVQMESDVLGADAARGVYEDIVRRRRDPALLEYAGRGCLRARVFPIPPQGDVTVEVVFRQVLPELGGLRRWSLALNAAGLEGRPPEQVVLDLSIRSRRPLKNAFSPQRNLRVTQPDDYNVRASFEGRVADLEAGELALFYGLSEAEFGLDLLTHRPAGAEEGTFLMLLSPKRDWADVQVLEKEVIVVLDVSGSMAGRKLEQAKGALTFFLGSLHAGDLFNVVPFATEAEPFFPVSVEATPANREAAQAKLARLEASGGTNIHDALLRALPAGGRGTGRACRWSCC